MNKKPLSKIRLKQIIRTTQAIEGYEPASSKIVKKIKQLRARYGIEVSPRK
jgi:hypothetical protein